LLQLNTIGRNEGGLLSDQGDAFLRFCALK